MQNSNSDLLVPRRDFGNSGVKISKLCLGGGSFANGNPETLLNKALKFGVDCWEIVSFTGNVYKNYFSKNPGVRESVFLSGKVYSTDPVIMEEQLNKLLKDNGTETIDFLAIHQIDNINALNNDIRKWAERAKKEKKIRYFGFCTHKNMAACLSGASTFGWIDGVQTVYNYRMRKDAEMEDAIQRCNEKGIGIFAVKSMGLSVQRKDELQELPVKVKLDALLLSHNVSLEKLILKAIWENPFLTSICSLMPDLSILESNISAAIEEDPINPDLLNLLSEYAKSTGMYYCNRCGTCDITNTNKTNIFGIMEMLMYSRGYGMKAMVAKNFAQIPDEIKSQIATGDYSNAEKSCQQKMPITRLMKEAYLEFHQD